MSKILAITVALLLSTSIFGQEKNYIDQNYIEVTSRAEREISPDEIYVKITINEKDNKGRVSLESQEREMFKALKSLNIDIDKDMQLQDLSSSMQNFFLKKTQILSSKSYILKVTSSKVLMQLFQSLEDIGLADISIIKTTLSNYSQIKNEVMADAAINARNNAIAIIEPLGRKVGKVIYAQSYDNSPINYRGKLAVAYSLAAEDANYNPQNMDFEKIKIEHSIVVRFAIE